MNEVLEIVPYSTINKIKKKQQIAFRRFMQCESGGYTISPYIGADIGTVRKWISDRMVDGMTWNNYGTEWQIDHIVPLRCFNLQDETELKICWHYKNLMPLFKKDNLHKEGNLFFAYVLLTQLKSNDYFYAKLLERIEPEIDKMNKYILTYCEA